MGTSKKATNAFFKVSLFCLLLQQRLTSPGTAYTGRCWIQGWPWRVLQSHLLRKGLHLNSFLKEVNSALLKGLNLRTHSWFEAKQSSPEWQLRRPSQTSFCSDTLSCSQLHRGCCWLSLFFLSVAFFSLLPTWLPYLNPAQSQTSSQKTGRSRKHEPSVRLSLVSADSLDESQLGEQALGPRVHGLQLQEVMVGFARKREAFIPR